MKTLNFFLILFAFFFISACKPEMEKLKADLIFEDAVAIDGDIIIYMKDSNNENFEFKEKVVNTLISYNFISEDGHTANKKFIGKKFSIIYIEKDGLVIDVETGEEVNGIVTKLESIKLIE